MRWVVKAGVQRVLGAVPRGDQVNYLLQRHVTRQLPRSDEHFRMQALETLAHFDVFQRYAGSLGCDEASFYEFGAGWDLLTPVIFYGLGVERQTLVDIAPNVRFEQVNHSLLQYEKHREGLATQGGRSLRPVDTSPLTSVGDLERRFGIRYLAPRDARDTGLPAGSFDFASSTFTLEHIPRPQIASILSECLRLLRPGGVACSAVDMQDHYSFFDPAVSAFNFLKFSDRTWALVNSPLHHQNRLQRSDYMALCEEAGFAVAEESIDGPSESDVETVRGLKLARRFRQRYGVEELAIRGVRIVGVKPDG